MLQTSSLSFVFARRGTVFILTCKSEMHTLRSCVTQSPQNSGKKWPDMRGRPSHNHSLVFNTPEMNFGLYNIRIFRYLGNPILRQFETRRGVSCAQFTKMDTFAGLLKRTDLKKAQKFLQQPHFLLTHATPTARNRDHPHN